MKAQASPSIWAQRTSRPCLQSSSILPAKADVWLGPGLKTWRGDEPQLDERRRTWTVAQPDHSQGTWGIDAGSAILGASWYNEGFLLQLSEWFPDGSPWLSSGVPPNYPQRDGFIPAVETPLHVFSSNVVEPSRRLWQLKTKMKLSLRHGHPTSAHTAGVSC